MVKTNGNMSFEEQKKQLENYNKAKAEQKKTLNFTPAAKTPSCAYCKKEGHLIRSRETGNTTCPVLQRKEQYGGQRNARRRASTRAKQNWVSSRAEKETGVGGWQTTLPPAGRQGNWSSSSRDTNTGRTQAVVTAKNVFDVLGSEEERMEVSRAVEEELWDKKEAQKKKEEAQAKKEEDAVKKGLAPPASTVAKPQGAWGKSKTVVVAPTSPATPVADKDDCGGCGDWGCQTCSNDTSPPAASKGSVVCDGW